MDDNIDLELYKIAVNTRNLEIDLFWKRSLFFWGFITATYIGYLKTPHCDYLVRFILLNFGFLVSLGWYLINRGGKYWQENWEDVITNFETHVDKQHKFQNLFTKTWPLKNKCIWGASEHSVSRITIGISWICTLLWAFILVRELCRLCNQRQNCALPLILIFLITIIFAGYMFSLSKMRP